MELIVIILIFLFVLAVVRHISGRNEEIRRRITAEKEAYLEKMGNYEDNESSELDIKREEYLPYSVKKTIMSGHERLLFESLRYTFGSNYDVYPQVNLDKIFRVERQSGKYYLGWLRKINQKSVDFLVVRRNTQSPILAIELDDSTHEFEDRRDRDEFVGRLFDRNNFPLVRFSPGCYKSEEIKAVFGKYLD